LDKRLARENIKLAKHTSKDLEKGDFHHALMDTNKQHHNLDKIRKEITSGQARRERDS